LFLASIVVGAQPFHVVAADLINATAGLLVAIGEYSDPLYIASFKNAVSTLVQTDLPRFESSACLFTVPAGAKVEWGYLVVLENRRRLQGQTIRLAVAILKSRSHDPAPDPIAYLEGGPGTDAFEWIGWLLRTPFLDHRDIIVLEQRGTRHSAPWLNCPEVDEALLKSLARSFTTWSRK
jgi:hypothetical protein